MTGNFGIYEGKAGLAFCVIVKGLVMYEDGVGVMMMLCPCGEFTGENMRRKEVVDFECRVDKLSENVRLNKFFWP